jgi:hypothetical protein
MLNYLNIEALCYIIKHEFVSYYDSNDHVVNVISNSICEKNTISFGCIEIANGIWEILLTRSDGNS